MLNSVVGANDKSSLLTGDLKDSSEQDTNPDYFNITITDLVPDTDYAIQFAWVYEDKTLSPYSANYDLHTIPITIPEVSNIVTEWSETQVSTNKEVSLKITFDRPEETINGVVTNLADSFIITLTYNSISKPITFNVNPNSTQQEYVLSESTAKKLFGVVPNQYSGLIQVVNADGKSDGVSFVTTSKLDGITDQPIPDSSWALTKVLDGYIVSWATFTDPAAKAAYDYTEIWQSTTESGTYTLIASGLSPQPIVYYSDLSTKYVKIRHRTKRGTYSLYSNVKQIKAADPSGYDANGPTNTSIISAGTPQIDSNGLFDFNYQIPFSWNENADTTTLGYKLRWRINGTSDPYTFMSVPGKSTTTANLFGVLAGKTYEVGLNVYDEYDNVTGTWSTTTVSVPEFDGSIKDTKYLKAGDMKLGYGIGPGAEANNKGLYLSPNNWWYIYGNTVTDNSAKIKIGSSTDYISWNGSSLDVTGIINAKGGNFTGSVSVGGVMSDNITPISGQLRVVTNWDTTVNPKVPNVGIEIGKLNQQYVSVPGVSTLESGIYAYDKTTSKYVLINAADGSIRANNAYIGGTLTTTGSPGSYTGNTLSMTGGKIEADNVIWLESPYIDIFGDVLINAGGLQVTGSTKLDQSVQMVTLQWNATYATASTYKVVGVDEMGFLNEWFGVLTSGAYGTTTPPGNIGNDGDFLFST